MHDKMREFLIEKAAFLKLEKVELLRLLFEANPEAGANILTTKVQKSIAAGRLTMEDAIADALGYDLEEIRRAAKWPEDGIYGKGSRVPKMVEEYGLSLPDAVEKAFFPDHIDS